MEKLAKLLKDSRYTVILTGAGMSTESGLADFRSQGGLWDGRDPMEISSVKAMEKTPEEFTEFFTKRIQDIRTHRPNEGHRILAEWEEKGLVHSIITQNIDHYHQDAGSKNVVEVHGNLQLYCEFCSKVYSYGRYLFGLPMNRHKCTEIGTAEAGQPCPGFVRPNVTLFGEQLGPVAWFKATQEIAKAEVLIVMGTSAEVYPVAGLPREARMGGAKVVVINREPISLGIIQDFEVTGVEITQVLHAINSSLS